MHANKLLAVAG